MIELLRRAADRDADAVARAVAAARPDVVATACLVAIMAQGPGYHCTAEADIERLKGRVAIVLAAWQRDAVAAATPGLNHKQR